MKIIGIILFGIAWVFLYFWTSGRLFQAIYFRKEDEVKDKKRNEKCKRLMAKIRDESIK
jgi:hypothetical protein